MKWGKKKQSSSRPFFISQVLPTSWLTKFKQMNMNSDAKLKQKGKWNSVTTNPSSYATTGGGGKFYGGDDDAFWRLSFGEDSLDDGMKSRGVLKSVLYNSDVDLEFPPSSCYSYRSNEAHKFADARKMRELPKEIEILPQAQVREIRTPRLRIEREKKLRKESFEEKQILELEETQKNPRKAVIVKNKPGKFVQRAGDSYLRKIEEDAEKESDGEWQKLKERKIEKVKSRSEEQRKSLYITRDLHGKRTKQNSKVRVNSPRTAEICKVKALQDMKKAKLKKKAIREEFQSFAVVKCSYDPQKDFRDSMIEMIKEHNISRPQQLEQLLACYLTLNSDQYHDLIIRVFRQVYQASFHTELENQECYYA